MTSYRDLPLGSVERYRARLAEDEQRAAAARVRHAEESAALLLLTDARDALHRQDPARPSVPVTYVGGARVDGSPGHTVCGQRPILGTNALGARSLTPSLGRCPACWAEPAGHETVKPADARP